VPHLVVIEGPDVGRRFDLAGEPAVVGRLSSNSVVLTDPRVSRRHFELRPVHTGVRLTDLSSGNGTLVNGVAVQTIDLRTGDRILLGDTTLQFTGDGNEPSDHTRVVVRAKSEAVSAAVLRRVPDDEGSQMLARPDLAASDWLRTRLASLTVLYEATTAVSDILDVDELLTRIVELVVRTTDADHGCALLTDPETGTLMPRAARSRSGGGELAVSRTVAEYVLREKQGVLISDAADDDRFRGRASIARHQIREVICVPMKGRRDTVGVLFLDTLAAAGLTDGDPAKFTEDHLKLAAAVAHQAALAVEETRYYQALIQAERLAAVGQTIAGLSHHIKNIMQGVRFGGDMVRLGLDGDDRELLTKGWRLVEKNQGRIDELILDMLSYSKEREPLAEPTDLAALAADVLEVVRGRAADGGVILELKADPLPPVACDPVGIHRALLNVVSNAVDAVADADAPRVTVSVTSADGFAELRVTDNGPGIPPEKREEVFKPFVSSKGSRGTGLGLPVSRKTLREHGGDVRIEDADGGGAVFVLRLQLRTT
jgi:signal transduction histidine kinase/pSer/pThr/pTyr-binding forkhead associated (FHA) protein